MLRNQNTTADVRNGNRLDADRVLGHVARSFTSRVIPGSSGKRTGAYCPEQQGIELQPGMEMPGGGEKPWLLDETTTVSSSRATGNAAAAIWARLIIGQALSS